MTSSPEIDNGNVSAAARTLAVLIERLEASEGPDRRLDADIHACIHNGYVESNGHHGSNEIFVIWNQDKGYYKEIISGSMMHDRKLVCRADKSPPYTASLDAAKSLLPDNHAWWEVRKLHAADSPARHFGPWGIMFTARVGMTWGKAGFDGNHDNDVIALCIAALKARAAHPPSPGATP